MTHDRTLIRKFGSEDPTMDMLCRLCGKRYGEHYGTMCSLMVDINPERTYNLHASVPRILNALENLVTALVHMGIPEELTEQFAEAQKALAQAKGLTKEG